MVGMHRFLIPTLAVIAAALYSIPAGAVPYASGARNTGGSTWEFVLNEAADAVTVLRDGGNAVNLGAISAGRHTFDMTGFSTFSIEVSKNAPVAYTEISSSANAFTNFVRPEGMAVNTDPSTPFFGTVYVNNARSDIPSAAGRTLADGVYSLTADLIGVDLSNNFAVVADANDTSQAFNSSWTVNESINSAWRMTLDDDGNVIVADWSDQSGGLKYARRDLSAGGPLLVHEDGIVPLLGNSADGLSGPEVHGSIVSKPYATGSIGSNLVVYGMDEDQDSDGETLNTANTGNHIWRWNVGNVTNDNPAVNPSIPTEYAGGYDQPPQLVINVSNIPDVSDGQPNFLDLNVGVLADAHYEPQFDKWYLTQRRSNGTESGLIVVTADGVDGNSPTLDWSSKQFSIDNSLDGFTDDPTPGQEASIGLQDIFREIGSVAISPDGKTMAVSRPTITGASNKYLGSASPLAGNLLIIPLDAAGLPDVQINDNGTPGDTTDDFLSNVQSITIGSDATLHFGLQVAFDAAGNLYSINNASERLKVYSPGGNWKAITGSNGTFAVMPLAGLDGDYNGDGKVDAADYVVWRKTDGSQAGYDLWRMNFGNPPGSGSGASLAAVPEPGSLLLVLIGLTVVGGIRRRN